MGYHCPEPVTESPVHIQIKSTDSKFTPLVGLSNNSRPLLYINSESLVSIVDIVGF